MTSIGTNLGRYIKALIPASGGLIAVAHDWVISGTWDMPHLRLALFLEFIAFLVYLFPNTPIPLPVPAPVPTPAVPTPDPVPVDPQPTVAAPDTPNERYIAGRLGDQRKRK